MTNGMMSYFHYKMIWSVGLGLIIGLLLGAFLQDMAYRWVLLVVVMGVIWLVLRWVGSGGRWLFSGKRFLEADDEIVQEASESVEVLSPDEAREWIDDLLVEQQKGRRP